MRGREDRLRDEIDEKVSNTGGCSVDKRWIKLKNAVKTSAETHRLQES